MRTKFFRELAQLGLPECPISGEALAVVASSDLDPLPEAARKYLSFMGVVGRPRDWSFQLSFTGRFRLSPEAHWQACRTWQYNSAVAVARVFHIRIRLGGLVPVLARDTYVDGRGRMLVRLLDLVPIADGQGDEFDIGELVTYLNDAILIAPSMLLAPSVRWTAVDEDSFDVELTDHGHVVRARVRIDSRGAPIVFETTDRFFADPKAAKPVRARWSTPIEGWRNIGGLRRPILGKAVWHLPRGDFAYAEFEPDPSTLAFNTAPGPRKRP